MIKNIFIVVVALVLVAGAYIAGGFSAARTIEAPPAQWAEGSQAAKAWREFLVSLEAAGARVFETTEDPGERLLGLQYLAQLASASLEMKVAKGNPADPAFTDWMSDYRKFLGDSPDAVYSTAEISSEHMYEISGNVGDAGYLGFMLYGKSVNGWNRAAGNLSLGDMQLSEEGNFRLLLSKERPQGYRGDWLELEDDIHMVMVRQYFHDRPNSEEARFTIRAREQVGYRAPQDTVVARRFTAASEFFNDTLGGNIALMAMIGKTANTFDTPKEYNPEFGGVFYPTHDNVYHGGWYSLEEGQALVIQGRAPDVDYWSISLQNRWMQTYDYRHFPVTLNNRDIVVDPDGNFTIVIAAENPGVDNWLSIGEFGHGLMAIRYQLATEAEPPSVKLLDVSDL